MRSSLLSIMGGFVLSGVYTLVIRKNLKGMKRLQVMIVAIAIILGLHPTAVYALSITIQAGVSTFSFGSVGQPTSPTSVNLAGVYNNFTISAAPTGGPPVAQSLAGTTDLIQLTGMAITNTSAISDTLTIMFKDYFPNSLLPGSSTVPNGSYLTAMAQAGGVADGTGSPTASAWSLMSTGSAGYVTCPEFPCPTENPTWSPPGTLISSTLGSNPFDVSTTGSYQCGAGSGFCTPFVSATATLTLAAGDTLILPGSFTAGVSTVAGQPANLGAHGTFAFVPEPSSLLLLGSGLVFFAWATRHRRQ